MAGGIRHYNQIFIYMKKYTHFVQFFLGLRFFEVDIYHQTVNVSDYKLLILFSSCRAFRWNFSPMTPAKHWSLFEKTSLILFWPNMSKRNLRASATTRSFVGKEIWERVLGSRHNCCDIFCLVTRWFKRVCQGRSQKKLMTEAMSMEDLWLRQSGWVLFLGIESVYSDKSERNYRGKCFGWPVTSYGGVCFMTKGIQL